MTTPLAEQPTPDAGGAVSHPDLETLAVSRFEEFKLVDGALPPAEAVVVDDAGEMLDVHVELGRAWLTDLECESLTDGTLVRLDRAADDPVDVIVGDRLVARGEVVVMNNQVGIRIVELLGGRPD